MIFSLTHLLTSLQSSRCSLNKKLRILNDGMNIMKVRPVFWHNMREEPVIYINGKPFLLREVERPYKNMLEYTVYNNNPLSFLMFII